MVFSCCAIGCRNQHGELSWLGFFRFPGEPEERRKRWKKDWPNIHKFVENTLCQVSRLPVVR